MTATATATVTGIGTGSGTESGTETEEIERVTGIETGNGTGIRTGIETDTATIGIGKTADATTATTDEMTAVALGRGIAPTATGLLLLPARSLHHNLTARTRHPRSKMRS